MRTPSSSKFHCFNLDIKSSALELVRAISSIRLLMSSYLEEKGHFSSRNRCARLLTDDDDDTSFSFAELSELAPA